MAAVSEIGTAERIRERRRPEQGWCFVFDCQRRPTRRIGSGAFGRRQPRPHCVQIGFEFLQFRLLHHARKDIKAGAPVRLEDIPGKLAVRFVAHRAAIAERRRPRFAGFEISLHCVLAVAITGQEIVAAR